MVRHKSALSTVLLIGAVVFVAAGCVNPFAPGNSAGGEQSIEFSFRAPLMQQVSGASGNAGRYVVPTADSAVVQVTGRGTDYSVQRSASLTDSGEYLQGRLVLDKVPAGFDYSISVTVYSEGSVEDRIALHAGSTSVRVLPGQVASEQLYLLPHEDVVVNLDEEVFDVDLLAILYDTGEVEYSPAGFGENEYQALRFTLERPGTYSIVFSDYESGLLDELGVVLQGPSGAIRFTGSGEDTVTIELESPATYYLGLFNFGPEISYLGLDFSFTPTTEFSGVTSVNPADLPAYTGTMAETREDSLYGSFLGTLLLSDTASEWMRYYLQNYIEQEIMYAYDVYGTDSGTIFETINETLGEGTVETPDNGGLTVSGTINGNYSLFESDGQLDIEMNVLLQLSVMLKDDFNFSATDGGILEYDVQVPLIHAGSRMNSAVQIELNQRRTIDDITTSGNYTAAASIGSTADDAFAAGKFVVDLSTEGEFSVTSDGEANGEMNGDAGGDGLELLWEYMSGVEVDLKVYNNLNQQSASYIVNFGEFLDLVAEYLPERIYGDITLNPPGGYEDYYWTDMYIISDPTATKVLGIGSIYESDLDQYTYDAEVLLGDHDGPIYFVVGGEDYMGNQAWFISDPVNEYDFSQPVNFVFDNSWESFTPQFITTIEGSFAVQRDMPLGYWQSVSLYEDAGHENWLGYVQVDEESGNGTVQGRVYVNGTYEVYAVAQFYNSADDLNEFYASPISIGSHTFEGGPQEMNITVTGEWQLSDVSYPNEEVDYVVGAFEVDASSELPDSGWHSIELYNDLNLSEIVGSGLIDGTFWTATVGETAISELYIVASGFASGEEYAYARPNPVELAGGRNNLDLLLDDEWVAIEVALN